MMRRLWMNLWAIVWDICEAIGIDLGRFAPWVFGQMVGSKGRRAK